MPAGAIEENETPEQAAFRELLEETGIRIKQEVFKPLKILYCRKPGLDYVFHSFKIEVDNVPNIRLSQEHESYQWISFTDIEHIDLMLGAKEALHFYW